ncbi:sugar phosphate isomerase/epimerase family protein [Yoonia sediminilitoris]|uniref:Sugar phosphate isomerase/epimerase n=1 Tax=Yoonia sediminilitoris TaxID=1286148 RepID=A0A2T6KPK1_9RHOB|nr:sugar phosphate isomerase/epimerase [Yoonia sediminilitoris]PUB18458.1 sugar phosphate isomerase/epimerase [Yoonia sediminilitoris]RCW98626.1 sugar phosphate isomerase/epimerase [Yoonia sediminilitoris]
MLNISYQLYCSRNFPPIGATLKMLSDAGFTQVEGYNGLFNDLEGLKAGLAETGLQMTSSHVGHQLLADDPAGMLQIIKDLGVKKVFAPHIAPDQRPTDAAGWAAFGQRLAEIGKPVQDAGLVWGWHNHDFELTKLASGEFPLDLMMGASDDLMMELDLGWVTRAGEDPVAWINKYSGRIAAAHIKDVAAAGECTDEDGWADVGHGTMDWPAIHTALQAAGCDHYVVEHDNPKDHQRFATRSLAAIQNF